MRRYGYHSHRSATLNGLRVRPDSMAIGVEFETYVERSLFDSSPAVRGARAETDGSLDYHNGVEFVLTPSEDLRSIIRRHTAIVERCGASTPNHGYGIHLNVNAQTKDYTWRKLMKWSFLDTPDMRAGILRQIGRRRGYSGYGTPGVISYLNESRHLRSFSDDINSEYTPGREGHRYAVALRRNRVEFRLFLSTTNSRVLLLYMLFARAWCEWIDEIRSQIAGVTATISGRDVMDMLAFSNFRSFLHRKLRTEDERANEYHALFNLVVQCHQRAEMGTDFMSEDEYVNAAGEQFNEVWNRLLAPQRRSRRTAAVATPVTEATSGEGVPVTA